MNKILYSLAQNKYWITFADQKVEVDMGLREAYIQEKEQLGHNFSYAHSAI